MLTIHNRALGHILKPIDPRSADGLHRVSMADVLLGLDDTDDAPEMERPAASILFLPDGIVSGRVWPTLAILEEHGYAVSGGTQLQLDPELIAAVRQYVPKPSTQQAILVRRLLEMEGPSIYMHLTCVEPGPVDAAERLNGLKGSAFPWLRSDGDVRSRLGSEHPMFKFFHAPDNQRAMERERQLFIHHRPDAFREFASEPEAIKALVEQVQRTHGRHDLDYATSLHGILSALRSVRGGAALIAETGLDGQAPRLRDAERFGWERVHDFIEERHVEVNRWDLLSVCAALTLVTE